MLCNRHNRVMSKSGVCVCACVCVRAHVREFTGTGYKATRRCANSIHLWGGEWD